MDEITHYWIKLLSPIHHSLAITITRIINTKLSNTVSIVPIRMPEGRAVMIPKKQNALPVLKNFDLELASIQYASSSFH